MKKSAWLAILVVIIVIVLIIILGRSSGTAPSSELGVANGTSPVPASETTKVSAKTSQYVNAELGFSVNYPSGWEAEQTNTGVTFIMPVDQSQVSTVAKLQGTIGITFGKCAFPPVTTIKDRGTLVVGTTTLNMISMTNKVQGRSYFDRMYELQNDSVCYVFAFSSITMSPESKNLTGSNLTQATNNNKAIIETADTDFTNMVKTFKFVQGAAGKDETQAAPAPKK